jgi:hypothetical protein
MKVFWWRLRLTVLMTWFGYTPKGRWNLVETWQWTGDGDSWMMMYDWGHSPMEALREDWSYGDVE